MLANTNICYSKYLEQEQEMVWISDFFLDLFIYLYDKIFWE